MDNIFGNISVVSLGDPDLSVLAVQGVLGEGQQVGVAVDIQVGWHHRLDRRVAGVVVHGGGVQAGVVIVVGVLLVVVHSGWQRLHHMVIQVMVKVVVVMMHNGGAVSQVDAIGMVDLGVDQVGQVGMVVATMGVLQVGQ